MSSKERLQENEYVQKGAYHRRDGRVPFYPSSLLYRFAKRQLPSNLVGVRCLDYGGGDAAFGSVMADLGADVSVFDLSERALRYAQRADQRLNLCVGKTRLPYADQAFGAVVMLEFLEHISDREEMLALREAKRVINLNGLLVISVPSVNLPLPEKHYRHYSWDDLIGKLKDVDLCAKRALFYKVLLAGLKDWPWPIRKSAKGLAYGADWLMRDILGQKGLIECNSPEEADGFVVLARRADHLESLPV